jgi:uncharacterized protein YjbJ (UPF0337 family)
MSWLEIKGTMNEAKGRVKQLIGRVLGYDLVFDEGTKDQLLGRMQRRLCRCRQQRRQVNGQH